MTTTTVDGLTCINIDDYLGPAEHRFFGAGYKRADHRLDSVMSGTDGTRAPWVSAVASVMYPSDWSRKGEVDQRPHLSTIDVFVLGMQLSEILLSSQVGLTEEQLRTAWVRCARIKAGSKPVEDNLTGLKVSARLDRTQPFDDLPGRQVSVMKCCVGALTIETEIDHASPGGDTEHGIEVALLSGPDISTYGEAFKTHHQRVGNMFVSPDRLHATAQVWFEAKDHDSALRGIEGHFQPATGMIDMFVVALQLGQVMLYELDGLTRAESNTLWMRSTKLEADSPPRPANTGPAPVTTSLQQAQLLPTRRGEKWRRADITAQGQGVRLMCSVAHQLP